LNEETAIERITETENLTDGLEDDDANWLLDWGISHVHDLICNVKDDEVAGAKINALMAVMRKLNQIAADRAAKPPKALAEDIQKFTALYAKAFGKAHKLNSQDYEQAASAIQKQSPREAMQVLINLASPSRPASWSLPGDPGRKDKPFRV
jgi:mitochondrial fission protein ELM1